MATTSVPSSPSAKTNRIGLEVAQYKGNKSTLCAGCGHNAISERIIEGKCFEWAWSRTASQALPELAVIEEPGLLY